MLIGSYRSFPCVAPTNDSPPLCYNFAYKTVGAEIPYQELNLEQLWEQFNIEHEPTRKGHPEIRGGLQSHSPQSLVKQVVLALNR